jgi:hypothetical protein
MGGLFVALKVEDTKRGRKFQRTNIIATRIKGENGEIKHVAALCYAQNTDSAFFVDWFRAKLVKSIPKGSTVIMAELPEKKA